MIITPIYETGGAHMVLSILFAIFATDICPQYAGDEDVTLMIMSGSDGEHAEGFMIYRTLDEEGNIEPIYSVQLDTERCAVTVIVGDKVAAVEAKCPEKYIFISDPVIYDPDISDEDRQRLDTAKTKLAEVMVIVSKIAKVAEIRVDRDMLKACCEKYFNPDNAISEEEMREEDNDDNDNKI
jgi:hypothetical protein